MFESDSPFARRGHGRINQSYPLDSAPCPYPAGSPERIETYARRAETGLAIFHPEDDKTTCAGTGNDNLPAAIYYCRRCGRKWVPSKRALCGVCFFEIKQASLPESESPTCPA